MRIVVDLDGTICEHKQAGQSYGDVLPLPEAVLALNKLKEEGHEIIIYTARHMKTCEGNVGKVLAAVGKITLDWIERYGVPFDEIVFGKPNGDVYIDDKGMRFCGWEKALSRLNEGDGFV